MEELLKQMYINEKLLQPDGTEVHLHDSCIRRMPCWEDENKIKEFGKEYNRIIKPFIGKNYDQFRILVLGLNLNQYGGYNELQCLVEQTIPFLKNGSKKIDFNADNYSGSIFWHRAYVYATILKSYLKGETYDKITTEEYYINNLDELLAAIDNICFTESVKCSPSWYISKPTGYMKNICPRYILKNELEILKPDKIIVLGKENWQKVRKIGKVVEDDWWYDKVYFSKIDLGYKIIDLYGTMHPCHRGGNKIEVIKDFAELVYKRHITN